MDLFAVLCCLFLGAEMAEMPENGKEAGSTQISLHRSKQMILFHFSTTGNLVVATVIWSLDSVSSLHTQLPTASSSFSSHQQICHITSLPKTFQKITKVNQRAKGTDTVTTG